MYLYRKIAVAGATAAAIVGVGTAALATSGATSTPTAGSGSAAATRQADHAARRHWLLRHGMHGEVVTDSAHGYVVHSAIRGTVEDVSSTAITVQARDGFSQTYTITKSTKIRLRATGQGKATPATAAQLHRSLNVAVVGKAPEPANPNTTPPTQPTATLILIGVPTD